MLKSILNDEELHRRNDAHSTIVLKLHEAFLAESASLSEIELKGDRGQPVPFVRAQTERVRRKDVDFMSACLDPAGLSVQLGTGLYPVALKLIVHGGGDRISICTKRTQPFNDEAVAVVLDPHTPTPEVMRQFFAELAKHVATPVHA